jgi:5-methyltetrahydropteroyltriglutamate--homocysteine methyltransferase
MQKTIVGYPRIGANRELKFSTEAYLKGAVSYQSLGETAKSLRKRFWQTQIQKGIDMVPSGDFSLYDGMLDTAVLVGAVPRRFLDLKLDAAGTYFAMARGYQDETKDIKALAMKKWFDTNYHYIVPEISGEETFSLNGTQPFDLYMEAKQLGIETRPVLIGPFTFLKLSKLRGVRLEEIAGSLAAVYAAVFDRFEEMGTQWVQIDEPALAMDLTRAEIDAFQNIYADLLDRNCGLKVLLQTYFGDIRDIYPYLEELRFDGIGLDFVDGRYNLDLISKYGFPKGKKLFAGIVSGRNVWKNDFKKSLDLLGRLSISAGGEENLVLSTSCSLLHVPYTVAAEKRIDPQFADSLAFADEKLDELADLAFLFSFKNPDRHSKYIANKNALAARKNNPVCISPDVRKRVRDLKPLDFHRIMDFEKRRDLQKKVLNLPLLPTTTIGSFPQTGEIKSARKEYRSGAITRTKYHAFLKKKIREIIRFQEDIGLNVLVHGEYERTDMVEYFGRKLKGFLFTENGWVQSYGTRAVKPPIIFGDIWRAQPLTLTWSIFAQKQTIRPVKGMLTGPVTILNWSFAREDLDLKSIAYQLALAIGDEVSALEKSGIKIIQIDEAALREKLPLRKENWHREYLDWAIPAFRLTHAKASPATQIHTHMCYSEFEDIIDSIEDMDADVISIEAARSDFTILSFLKEHRFKLEIGPGIYDIHSPRIPPLEEMEGMIEHVLEYIDPEKVWVNPDCGLKTRNMDEAAPSIENMVRAAENVREKIKDS